VPPMKRVMVFIGISLICSISNTWADFSLSFDSADPAWAVDRYSPAGFTNVTFDGDSRLQMTISPADSAANRPAVYNSTFYNTQGYQHPADITGTWSIMAQTYVGLDSLSGPNLRRTDVWASTGLNGTETGADYFILGYYRMDPSDPYNASSPGITSGWRVFDDNTGWVNLSLSLTAGWHDVTIAYDATLNLASYMIDGQSVYTETPGGDYAYHLRNVNLEAFNFGQDSPYNVYWDNLQSDNSLPPAMLPEPTGWSMGLVGMAMCVLMTTRKR